VKKIVLLAAILAAAGAYAANEISALVSLAATKGYVNVTRQINQQWDITNAAPNVAGGTQIIGTNAAEVILFGDVVTPGWSLFRNLGTNSHSIALGVVDTSTNFMEFARLEMGEYGMIPVGTNALYGISYGTNEAGTVLEKIILDR
jgi:hypothetical protein